MISLCYNASINSAESCGIKGENIMNTKGKSIKTQRSVYRSIIAILMSAILAFVFMSDTTRAVIALDRDIVEDEFFCRISHQAQLYRDEVSRRLEAESEEDPHILLEDISRRTSFERYFFMSDGSVMREEFIEPIHFAYDEYIYRQIDNSFVARSDERGNSTIVNRSNAFQTEFAVNPNDNLPLAAITSGEHSLQFFSATQGYTLERQRTQEVQRESQLENSERQSDNFVTNEITERRELSNVEVESKFMTSDEVTLDYDYSRERRTSSVVTGNLTSELSFSNIEPNIDRRFEVTQFGMSENIIINERQRRLQFAFEFVIRAEGLELVNSNNRILAYDYMMERIFYIPTPYMFDAYGYYNTSDVVYNLEYLGDYEYRFIITACSMWINATDRAFPVQISSMNVQPLNGIVNFPNSNFTIIRISEFDDRRTGIDNHDIRHSTFYNRRLMVQYSAGLAVRGNLLFDIHNTSSSNRQTVIGNRLQYGVLNNIRFHQLPQSPNIFNRELLGNQTAFNQQIEFVGSYMAVVFRLAGWLTSARDVTFRNFRIVTSSPTKTGQPINFSGDDFNVSIDSLTLDQRAIVPYFIQQAPIMPIEVYGVFNPGFTARRNSVIANNVPITQLRPPQITSYGLDMKLNFEQYMLRQYLGGRVHYIYIDAMGDFHLFMRLRDKFPSLSYRCDNLFRSSTTDLIYDGALLLGNELNKAMFRFDARGRLDRIRNNNGQAIYISHDASGRISSIRNYFIISNFSFMPDNRLFSSVNLRYHPTHGRLNNIGFSGLETLETTIAYHSCGRVHNINIPSSAKNISLTYSFGNLYHITNSANARNGFLFTRSNNLWWIREHHENSNSKMRIGRDEPNNRTFIYSYGRHNNNFQYTLLYRTYHRFDDSNRLVDIQTRNEGLDNINALTREHITKEFRTSSYTYNGISTGGRTTNITRHNYRMSNVSDTGSWQYIRTYTNTSGALIRKIVRQDIICNFTGNILEQTTQNIDGFRRITQNIHRDLRETITTTYVYDSNSARRHILTRIDTAQTNVSFNRVHRTYFRDHNKWGFPEDIRHGEVVGAGFRERVSESFDFDNYGNLISHTDTHRVTHTFEYDWLGDTGDVGISTTGTHMGIINAFTGNEKIVFNYDDYMITSISTQDMSGTIRYTHNINQSFSQNSNSDIFTMGSVTHRINYSNGKVASIARNNVNMLEFDYTPKGDIVGISFANNQRMAYSYNAFGQMTQKRAYTNGMETQRFNYGYHRNGELGWVDFTSYGRGWSNIIRSFRRIRENVTGRENVSEVDTIGLSKRFRVTTEINPNNDSIGSTSGSFVPVAINYQFDNSASRRFSISKARQAFNNSILVTDALFTANYTFDTFGRLDTHRRHVTTGSSQVGQIRSVHYFNDRVDRVVDALHINTVSQGSFTTTLWYDTAGNISHAFGGRVDRNIAFGYRHGRLEWEEWDCAATNTRRRIYYKYDANNNLARTYEYRIISTTQRTRVNAQRFNHSGDRLTGITNTHRTYLNKTIPLNSYDDLGNPLVYGNWDMAWVRGRLLHTMRPRNGLGNSWEFRYDENGIRYRKIERNATNTLTQNTTDFFVNGTQIIAEHSGRYGFIEYFYDTQGVSGMRVSGVLSSSNPNANQINNRNFLFLRDVFGNVVEIRRDCGLLVARYSYDAWGNTSIVYNRYNIGHMNPFRYRGKYMDRGTGLYYLQTRFYDPAIRRFINADNFMLVPHLAQSMELNMHAYARNNPVMFTDPTGQLAISTLFLIGMGVGFALGFGGSVVVQGLTKGWDSICFWTAGIAGVTGAIGGGLMMTGLGAGWMALAMAGLSGVNNVGSQLLSDKDFNVWQLLFSMAAGGAVGWLGGSGVFAKKPVIQAANKLANQKKNTANVMANLAMKKKPGTAAAKTNWWLNLRTTQFNNAVTSAFGQSVLQKTGASAFGWGANIAFGHLA